MNVLRINLIRLAVLLTLLLLPMTTAVSAVDSGLQEEFRDPACEGITGTAGDCGDSADVDNLLANALNIISFVIGAAALIMIIVGGIRYVFSGGDAQQAASARQTIIYSLVGLVVAIAAQGIIRLVFDTF